MAHGSMSKTLVLILAASIPVGYVIWMSNRRAAQKNVPAASSAPSSSAS